MNHSVIPPNTNIHGVLFLIWDQMDVDVFVQGCIWNLNIVTEKRNASVGIDPSLFAQTKDIIRGDIGFRERKRPDEAVALS